MILNFYFYLAIIKKGYQLKTLCNNHYLNKVTYYSSQDFYIKKILF